MLHRTEVRGGSGSLITIVPADVARSLGLSDGMELFWVIDDQGGCRISVAGGERARRIVDAHEDAIALYSNVFRELAK